MTVGANACRSFVAIHHVKAGLNLTSECNGRACDLVFKGFFGVPLVFPTFSHS